MSSPSKGNILVVDDTHANLHLLTEILTASGYTVRPVPSAKLAISSTKAAPPDLILLDIMMPETSGYEVCEQLKTDERTRDIPVIFISALNEVFDKVKAFSVGGVDYITKPFQPEEVLVRVKTHLTLQNLQKELQQQNTHLRQEIIERKRVEDIVRQHNRELLLLNQMHTSFQACHSEGETYRVLKNICQEMFPSDSGCLYMITNMQNALKIAAFWNSPPANALILDEYQQLRSGEMYVIDSKGNPLYLYLDSRLDNGYPCTLRDAVSGEILGVLLLRFTPDEKHSVEEFTHRIESKQLSATRLAEQYSLLLVNLRLREALRREAIRDPLTGLYNRRYMEEALERETQRAKRYNAAVGLIMLDVDHFKLFNDKYGHEAGDVVLEELGKLLQHHIRGGDIACRYGGEEFLLILPDATLEATKQRAMELLKRVQLLHVIYQGKKFSVTASLGVAALPQHGSSVHSIVSAVDSALYQAKELGRNQVAIASS